MRCRAVYDVNESELSVFPSLHHRKEGWPSEFVAIPFPANSKRIFQRELQLPGWLRGEDLAEKVVAHIDECGHGGRYRIRGRGDRRDETVGKVESIGAKLEALLLANLKVPRQGHIQTPEPRADDTVPADVAYRSERLGDESRRVEVLASRAALTRVDLI